MNRYFIKIAYKGTNYHGWQLQKNANSVQSELEKALAFVLPESVIKTTGAGRTDTGVHARTFFAHFDTMASLNSMEIKQLIYSLNGILPRDIVVHDILPVKHNANARFDATSRTYCYYICTNKNPFYEGQVYYFYSQPDVGLMNLGADLIKKQSDFSSFSKSGTQTKTNNCKVTEAQGEMKGDLLVFTIKADRFLRNMVRAVAGTLIELGMNKFGLPELQEIINSKNRSRAGCSLPAEGLFLEEIEYPEDIFI